MTKVAGMSSVVVALLAGVAVSLNPTLTFAALLGVVAVGIAVVAPRATVIAGVIVAMFASTIANAFHISLGPLEELAVGAALVASLWKVLSSRGRVRWPPGSAYFSVFLVVGVVSGMLNGSTAFTTVVGGFVVAKILVLGFALTQFTWSSRDGRRLGRAIIVLISILLISVLGNIAFESRWTAWFAPGIELNAQFGITPVIGIFSRPGALSRLCEMVALGLLGYFLWKKPARRVAALFVAVSAVTFLTFISKSLVALSAGTAFLLFASHKRAAAMVASVVLLPVVAIAALPLLNNVLADVHMYSSGDSARGRLMLGSLYIASQHFPLGAGFGRFGSPLAASQYSSEYVSLGFPYIYGLSPTQGFFLNDTAWPAILGESGWLGALLFAAGLVSIFIGFVRHWRSSRTDSWLGAVGIAWLIAVLLESTSGPVFTSPPSYPILLALSGILTARRADSAAQSVDSSIPLSRTIGSRTARSTRGGERVFEA